MSFMRQKMSPLRAFLRFVPTLALVVGCNHRDTSTSAAQATSQSKVAFEQRTGMLVWDVGRVAGQIDAGDDMTDMSLSCSVENSSDPTLPLKDGADIDQSSTMLAAVNRILTRIGIADVSIKMNPVLGVEGQASKAVFLLFPELHLEGGADHTRALLHQARALDMWALAEALVGHHQILNTDEGPQGFWPAINNHTVLSGPDRRKFADALIAKTWEPGAMLLSELFYGQITSREQDSNDLAIKYVLTLDALTAPGEDWTTARTKMVARLPTRASLVNVESYRSFNESLRSLSPTKLVELNTDLCEQRSRKMLEYTSSLALSQRADVVFMSFGALHAHGVLEQIRRLGASAIVYSPNL